MIALDFFCGAGGLTRGLLNAGIEVVAGFDCEEDFRNTYENNNPEARFIHADIKKLSLRDLAGNIKLNFQDVLFAGCAPCQAFSKRSMSRKYGQDAELLSEFGRLVEEALPGYVFMENVPGIAENRGQGVFQRFLSMLRKNDYLCAWDILDAKHYGVPQKRKRLVLLASKRKQPSLPKPEYGEELRTPVTVREAISHFPTIAAGESNSEIPNHVAASLTELNLERLKHTPLDGGDRRSWPEHLVLNCHKGNYQGHTDAYGRMFWDSPAPTITGRCNSLSNGRYGHPEQNRAISIREAAAIQSFPDDYVFFGSTRKSITAQVGNAVPVKMAESIGEEILRL